MSKLLLLIFISFSLRLAAQTSIYHTFPDSNAVWNQHAGYLVQNIPVQEPHNLFYSGDTIVSTFTYKRLLSTGYRYNQWPGNGCCYYYNKPSGFIRQDTAQRKVYYYNSYETLLYDFNLSVGDTLPGSLINDSLSGNYVSSIDSVLVGSDYRKLFHISVLGSTNAWDSNYVQLIEGIGSTFGLLSPLMPPFENGTSLTCFILNDTVLYPSPTSNCNLTIGVDENDELQRTVSAYPNPSTGIFTVNFPEKFQYSIYDVFGTEIVHSDDPNQSITLDLSAQPKGIYFFIGISEEKMVSRKIILQ